MPELDDLEARIAAGVRAFADRADTRVDAAAVAWIASADRARARPAWPGRLRLTLAWALLLALLLAALLALPVYVGAPGRVIQPVPSPSPTAAAGPSDAAAVQVTRSCPSIQPGAGPPGPATGLAAAVLVCTDAASDPRVSGSSTTTVHVLGPAGEDGRAGAWGAYRLDGPHGSWVGAWYGILDAAGQPERTGFARGSGAYDGWTYAFGDRSGATTGVIYFGPPPSDFPLTPPAASASPTPTTAP
jgi:hypothetical protein